MNEGTLPVLGYLPQEIRGRLITDFIHAGDFPDPEHQASVRLKG